MKIHQLLRYIAPVSVAGALLAGCSTSTNGLATAEAVLACSDHVFWGTVEKTSQASDGLHVSFQVDDWIWPASGEPTATLVAEDPSEHAGAPDWNTSERVLVLDEKSSPLDMMQGEAAEDMAAALKQADTPILACPGDY